MSEGLARGAPRPHVIVFYDGECGLCHRSVSFLLSRDRERKRFRFAAQQGATFAALLTQAEREALPDSVVLLMPDGALHARWNGAREALRLLGGPWRAFAALMGIVPRAWGDRLYDAVARRRKRFFISPSDTCPPVPPDLRPRFLP